jgi:crotonobetainyl-CoA:carnitine CoA-transferase CaiB-like acyl-CoA transferase
MKKEEFFARAIPGSVGPLQGIKILEATVFAAGPLVGTVLTDLGAESVKCDPPETGDTLRRMGPFVGEEPDLEASSFYLAINRNKKSITLKLSSPEGQEIFRDLAQRVDVVVQNFKPGTRDKWGLGYEAIRRIKPDVIYTSISGFGQFGPLSHKPGFDSVGQAMGGLMNINGYPDRPPMRVGNAIIDNITGWMGAMATISALFYREKTGEGQHIDANLLDTTLYASDMALTATAHTGLQWQRTGGRHPSAPPSVYSCIEDYVLIILVVDSHWARFCRIAGREDLIDDPRTQTGAARGQHPELIEEVVAPWTRERTVKEVVSTLEEAEIVVAPILNYEQILENDHVRERGMIEEVEHSIHGKLKLYGVGPKLSRTPGSVRSAAPLLGEHNQEVYRDWLGLSGEKLAQLKDKGVI